ncbi:MAG TPA: carboxypeptidase-like regulatory domain-containing protein [Terriglobales bacterium]|nr:carboxypeptidase-like regulatory domain-containing protein [Terriglobales bacterium]
MKSHIHTRIIGWLSWVGLCLGLAALAQAQATTSLHGQLTDPSGAAVAGAVVRLASPATGFARVTSSDATGVYEFQQLAPGTYTLTVTAKGFAVSRVANLTLLVNEPATVNLSLKLAAASTAVEVQGATAPLINTTDATLGNAFNTVQLTQLPIADRNVVELLSLQPGVVYTGDKQLKSDYDTRTGAVNGIRSDQSNVTLDGVDVNDQNNGYAFTSVLNIPPDSVQEFRVTTADPNADSGHSGGAEVAFVTRSGTNQFHGSLYEFNRNTNLSANDFFLKTAELTNGLPNQRPQLIRNVYGFTLGGPIKKNRLFFFANYEGRQDRQQASVERTVPSAQLRQGFISYVPADPSTCPSGHPAIAGITCYITLSPADIQAMDAVNSSSNPRPDGGGQGIGVSPDMLKYLQAYPMPNDLSVGDGLNFVGYRFAAPTPAGFDTYITRLDYNITADGSEKLFWRGQLQNFKQNSAPQFPGMPPATTDLDDSRGSILGITSVISPTAVNSFEWGYIRQGLSTAGDLLTSRIIIRNLTSLYATSRTHSGIIPVHNLVDNFSWIKGNHTLQFGANVEWTRDNRLSLENSFSDAVTNADYGDTAGFANHVNPSTGEPSPLDPVTIGKPQVDPSFQNSYDFPLVGLMGILTEGDGVYNFNRTGAALAQGAPVKRNYAINEYEFYGQDAWRVTPNLTFTYGLRWTLEQPPWEINGEQVTPCVTQSYGSVCENQNLADWFNNTGALAQQGKPASAAGEVSYQLGGPVNHGPGYWGWDYKDFAPRIALAWSPDFGDGFLSRIFGKKGTASIRGGYSIMYDHFGTATVNTFDATGAIGLSTDISNAAGVITVQSAPRFTAFDQLPAACPSFTLTDMANGCIFGPTPVGQFPAPAPQAFAIAWGLDSTLKTPYAHMFNFSIGRQLTPRTSLQLSYVGSIGRRLMMEDDLAMPADVVDPASKMDYFTAAKALSMLAAANTPAQQVQTIPYWQNLFSNIAPNLASPGVDQNGNPLPPALTIAGWNYGPTNANGAQTYVNIPTVTQYMYSLYANNLHNETTALAIFDSFPNPANANSGPFTYFHDQFSSLYAWRSIGTSDYNALQASYNVRAGDVNAQFNYTYSKSLDEASDAERVGAWGGLGGNIINAWDPYALRGRSDFDTRSQISANWVWELPFGRGKWLGSGAGNWLNGVIGGWQLSGDYRWTTGFPVNVANGYQWPTDWQLGGEAMLIGAAPKTQHTDNVVDSSGHGEGPNMFPDPAAALAAFRPDWPGESGMRNVINGDGMFNIDSALAKTFNVSEGKALQIRVAAFNLTNTVRFDAQQNPPEIDQSSSFGKYTDTLVQPRFIQLGLRFTF